MTERKPTAAEHEALRARVSALSAASLRISASLDLETVLNEVVESARALTGARFGAIATIDETGAPQDFVTSGFTEEEHRRIAEWPDGPRLFEHFRDLPGPVRIADVPAYVRDLGFSTDRLPSKTFQGTPMRHRGVHVGNFYLVEKEGGDAFTDRDEEILVLFASQAATAIANARAYRAERRARADLEALIETSPVGVVVLDGRTGHPVSLNREARRIVESLRMPGHTAEDLLGILTCRFTDGREIALDRLPLTSALSRAETVRAEEIVLTTPDGRSVTTLINATPIDAEDGTLASVVVTMQDLAPLQELERMRAQFLGMVSHELRVPLTSIKGSSAAALGASRHCPDTAAIRIAAQRDGVHVAVSVSDEAGASRRSASATCSANTPSPGTGRTGSAAGWDWPSARDWSRPMADASGPRAPAWASAHASPSRSRWPPRPSPSRAAPTDPARRPKRCPSSWSTMTRKRCAMSATRSPTPASPPWSPATPTRYGASSWPRSPGWCCST